MAKNQLWKRISAIVLAALVAIPAGIATSNEVKAAESIIANGDFDNDTAVDTNGWNLGEAQLEAVKKTVNAISNGTFEDGTVDGWTITNTGNVAIEVVDDATQGKVLSVGAKTSSNKVRRLESTPVTVPTDVTSVNVSFKYKVEGESSGNITFYVYEFLDDESDYENTTVVTTKTTNNGWVEYNETFTRTTGFTKMAIRINMLATVRVPVYVDDIAITYEAASDEMVYSDGITMDGSDYAMKLSDGNSATYDATLTAGNWYKYSYDVHTEGAASGFTAGLKLGNEIKTATSGYFQATEGMTIGFGTNGTGTAYFDNLVVTALSVSDGILTLNRAQADAGADYLYLTGSDAIAVTGDDCSDAAWGANRLTVVDGDANGVFVNNEKISPSLFVKYSSGLDSQHKCWYYIKLPVAANNGDVLTIKGAFALNDSIINFREMTYTWNGTKWVENTPADETAEVSFDTGNGESGFYILASDSMPVVGWEESLFPLFDGNSGVWVNNEWKNIPIKRYAEDKYYVGLVDGVDGYACTAQPGDVIRFGGKYTYGGHVVEFYDIVVIYDGTRWYEQKEVTDTKLTLYGAELTDGGSSASAFYAGGFDGVPATGWVLEGNEGVNVAFLPFNEESGIWVGDTRVGGQFKKYATDKYYVEGFTVEVGQIVTVKGIFRSDASEVDLNVKESKFVFNGSYWEEVIDVADETGCTFSEISEWNDAGALGLVGNDTYSFTSWDASFKAAYGDDNGVFFNGNKITVPVKRVDDCKYYISLAEATGGALEPVMNDKLVIKGAFTAKGYSVQYNETVLTYSGSAWVMGDVHFHKGVKTDAKEANCYEDGNITYWTCECGRLFTDEACTNEVTLIDATIKASHTLVHFDAIEPACHYNGQVEYWYCSVCQGFFLDEACTRVTNSKSVVLPATGSDNVEHVEAKEPTCISEGNIEYWYCPDCEQFWQDEACTQLTNSKNVIIGALAHDTIHREAITPGCHYDGQIEHWYCPDCEGFWEDAECKRVTNSKSVVLPATGSENLQHVAAVEPACHYNGNVEYWHCPDCEQYWTDELCTVPANSKNVILPATGSDKLVHFDAVEPGCHFDGNVEYWYCADCEQFWTDALLTVVSNSKNVVLPATGSDNVAHVEAKAPTCTEEGNVEYWHCADCEKVWTDAAYTQLTNIKNVVLPAAGHKEVKVAAVAATTTKTGNKAGTKCSVCGEILSGCEVIAKIVKPGTTKITKVTAKKKALTIKWKKKSGVAGYEVQVSLKKNFKKIAKKATVKNYKKVSTTIKKLKSGKKYYVRIRTYKVVNGVKVTSNWVKFKKAVKAK